MGRWRVPLPACGEISWAGWLADSLPGECIDQCNAYEEKRPLSDHFGSDRKSTRKARRRDGDVFTNLLMVSVGPLEPQNPATGMFDFYSLHCIRSMNYTCNCIVITHRLLPYTTLQGRVLP